MLSVILNAQEKKPLSFVDIINLKRVYGPSLSPDGERLLFTVSEADWKKNKSLSHIWRIHVDGTGLGRPRKTRGNGWSAGGHMTNWLITQTDRFKAASSGAGASNWISMYAQSDVRIYRTAWFGSDPWHANSNLKTCREHSPIFFVSKAKTPTLLMFGQNDNRVPLPQGVEMYRGLKANGVPVELVIFPREGHGPRELRHMLFKMNKEFQWFEKHIMGRDFQFENPPPAEKTEEESKDSENRR